jgi:eukaryotic-like serine/threonine-protein kinase
MSLAAGTKLGPYEIIAPLGAGGMGEVYRGRDPRLGRAVAIKVLPESMATDSDRLSRFQQEARTAGALNHPNIIVVYDVGAHGSNPYLVTELLEGETLRQQLQRGALPLRKAVDYGVQLAQGLSAAHGKGIVHRDLKPENLFITEGGHVKILDFGLAKLSRQLDAEQDQTLSMRTAPGTVLGTAAYMSPEQVRGLEIDARSDIFSLGAILYEILSGRRAFQGKTAADTMSSILTEEPRELVGAGGTSMSPAIDRIVRRCLEKNRQDRFQSAQDLGFALEAVGGSSASASGIEIASVTGLLKRRLWAGTGALVLVGVALLVGHYFGSSGKASAPSYQALTFRRGLIHSARFAPDGSTIVYAAAWNGGPSRVFVTRLDSPESRPLDQANVNLLGVSSTGEVAISVGCTGFLLPMFDCGGTLARMSLSGGAPRELSSDIRAADWSPDGKSLAVVRQVRGGSEVEYPIGTVLAQSAGWITPVRISPSGDAIAYADHPAFGDDAGFVKVIDTKGHPKSSSGHWGTVEGVAWTPGGKELWFAADNALRALTPSGRQRFLLSLPGITRLHDISSDGRLLLTTETFGLELLVHRRGEQRDKDLSWLAGSCVSDISRDGRTLTFWDGTDSATSNVGFDTYMGDINGAAPVKLGPGDLGVFSPKSDWVLTALPPAHNLELLPTGAGDAKVIDGYGIQNHVAMAWLPDGRTISFAGNDTGQAWRMYLRDIGGGKPRAITPDILQPNTYDGPSASPDGALVWARDTAGKGRLYPIKGGASIPLRNLLPEDQWIKWTADGQGAYVFNASGLPARVYRIDFQSGKRTEIFSVMPADAAGVAAISVVRMTPDEASYAYSYVRLLSKLFLVTGVK